MALIRYIEVALGLIDRVVVRFVGSLLLLMTVVLFANSIGRAAFSVTFSGGPALGRLLMIWMTFMAAYLLVRSGGHVTIDIASRMVSRPTRRWLSIIIGIVGGVTMGYVSWLGYTFTSLRFNLGQMDPMLLIPTGYFYLAIPVASALMTLGFFHNSLKSFLEEPLQGIDNGEFSDVQGE
jgi:TRAP-type C4-dicarboxylate transport system permease small subunit